MRGENPFIHRIQVKDRDGRVIGEKEVVSHRGLLDLVHKDPTRFKLVERFPAIIQLGAAVLAYTAAQMIVNEPLLDAVFDPPQLLHTAARWAT